MFARLLPDGNYAVADSHGAPPYLAAVRQLGHYFRVQVLRMKALVAKGIAVWQPSIVW